MKRDTSGDDELREAWYAFCDGLKESGDFLFQDAVPASPTERAESFRYLTQAIALGFEFHVENEDPTHPYLQRYFSPWRKQGGDNADAIILGAWIDGSKTYRIVGNRGSCRWLNITVVRPRDEDARGGPLYEKLEGMGYPYNLVLDAAPLPMTEMEFEWDGSFVVTLSPDPHPGNWIQTTPKTCVVRIREFFSDWENEQPIDASIELVGDPGPPPLLAPGEFIDRLQRAAAFARASASYWPAGIASYGTTNEMVVQPQEIPPAPGESWSGRMDNNPKGQNASTNYRLELDEALVIRFRPPVAHYWSFELDNIWITTMDYRWRFSSLNMAQAVPDPDGLVTVVLAHDDPGTANWLDTSGWRAGYVNFRALFAETVPEFTTEHVKFAQLEQVLPPSAARVNADERRAQLRARKRGVDRRFRV